MKSRRISRVNSLLKEVLSEVIRNDFKKHGEITDLLTVLDVETTHDLEHAKVFISVIGTDALKKQTLEILNHARGYIAVLASKKITLRYFPELHFVLDDGIEKQMRIEELLKEIKQKESPPEEADDESKP